MKEITEFGSRNMVPGSLVQMLTLAKYVFLDFFRSRRFFILLTIALAVGALLTGIVDYYRPGGFLSSVLQFYYNWWGQTAPLIIVLSAVFFGGDAISGEFQNKTGYFLVGNPIRRSVIYLGKWIAAFCASLIVLLIFALVAVSNGVYYFGATVPIEFWEALAFSVLYLASAMGLTFFFSSVFKSNSMSILVTVILLIFVFSVVQTFVASLAKTEPWFILTYGAQIISNVLQSPYPSPVQTGVQSIGAARGFSITSYSASIPEGIAIMLIYFLVATVGGLLLFERKEFS